MSVLREFQVGSTVRCSGLGSWIDGKTGTVIRLDETSSDGIFGCLLQMEDGVTIVPEDQLELVAYPNDLGELVNVN